MIMVLSMIMLLVMTTMGVGLWYVADREIQQVTTTINRSETLYSSETCVDEAINWLRDEAAKGPPCKGCTPFTTIRTIPNSGNRIFEKQTCFFRFLFTKQNVFSERILEGHDVINGN